MACRVGICVTPDARIDHWKREEGHTSGGIVADGLTYDEAQEQARLVAERRHPVGRPLRPFLPVRRRLHGQQVQRVVGERPALVRRPGVRAVRPGPGERHDVIDVHLVRGRERLAGVQARPLPGRHGALARVGERDGGLRPRDQHLGASVLPVPVRVRPVREFAPVVVRHRLGERQTDSEDHHKEAQREVAQEALCVFHRNLHQNLTFAPSATADSSPAFAPEADSVIGRPNARNM